MIRILHVLNELRPSGAEVMLKSGMRYWREDYDMDILSTGENIGEYADALRGSGFDVIHMPIKIRIEYLIKLWILFSKYDIIHIHTEKACLEYALIARLLARKKCVRTIHSYFKFKGQLRIKRTLRRGILRMLKVKQVSIGSAVQNNEISRFGNRTEIINNWYDDDKFRIPTTYEIEKSRKNNLISENKLAIVSIGNCANIKNHGLIIKALVGTRDIIYYHIGLEDSSRQEYALAKALGVKEKVVFIGFDDPLKWLWACDVYIMPSRIEGFGISAVEAISTGIPCALSNIPGLKDLVELDNEIAWFDPSSAEQLREILEKFAKDRPSRRNGIAVSRFHASYGAQRYSELYRFLNKRR